MIVRKSALCFGVCLYLNMSEWRMTSSLVSANTVKIHVNVYFCWLHATNLGFTVLFRYLNAMLGIRTEQYLEVNFPWPKRDAASALRTNA